MLACVCIRSTCLTVAYRVFHKCKNAVHPLCMIFFLLIALHLHSSPPTLTNLSTPLIIGDLASNSPPLRCQWQSIQAYSNSPVPRLLGNHSARTKLSATLYVYLTVTMPTE